MKDILSKSVLIVVAIGLLYLIFLRECKQSCPPDGYQIVSNEFIDSLKIIAGKPPEIIIKDSIVYRDTIIYIIKSVPTPVTITPELKEYRDSVYNDSIRVWTNLLVNGTIVRWDTRYQPIIHYRTITEKINVPYPVIQKVPENADGIFISGLLGGDFDKAAFGIGLDYVTYSGLLYGAQYNRFDDKNIYQLKFGVRITSKKIKK